MNKVFLIGRLSRDPELRHTGSGTAVCQISVAISRPVAQGSEPQTDFINVTIWNKQAENVAKYLAKGRQVAVEGRIQTNRYTNNEGKTVYSTQIVASSIEFLGSKDDTNKANNNNNGFEANSFDTMEPMMDTTSVDDDPFASFGEKVEISDSELPF